MTTTITLTDANAVKDLTIPIPEGGSIIVIHGPNDSGKSKTLDVFDKLLGGNAQIAKRYGSKRGIVEGFGMRLDLMANVRASGELEAVSLTGKLDIGTLIDPGLKQPERADAARVKALLTVRGVKADLGRFVHLVGDDEHCLGELASDATRTAKNLVDMAACLKQDLESASRKAADNAKTAEAGARAKLESVGELDMEDESDSDTLQGLLEAAIKHEAATVQTRVGQVTAANKRDTAKRNLAEAEAKYEGPTLEEARREASGIAAEIDEAGKNLADAHRALEKAEEEQSRLSAAHAIAKEKLRAAIQHKQAMAGWSETIESAANVEEVSNKELSEAVASVEKARETVENGVRIRDAKKALAEAKDLQVDAGTLKRQADQLRDAAKGTNDVLADAVQAGTLIPVFDDNGHFRLAVRPKNQGDRRTYYHELGPGMRTRIAITEFASCLRALNPELVKIAVFVLPQGPWQDLDYANRCLVWKHVKSLGVTLATAQCDSDPSNTGPIRVEVFEPEQCQEALA